MARFLREEKREEREKYLLEDISLQNGKIERGDTLL
jgi:hypothetical protein